MRNKTLFLLLSGLLFAMQSGAQQTLQTIVLHAGWNAVHLVVHPETNACEAVLAGLNVETVWGWNRRFSPVQFISEAPDNIAGGVPKSPDWLSYFPPGHPLRDQRSLFAMDGGKTYLIKLPDGAQPTPLNLRGRPAIRGPDWVTDGFTLVGFGVDLTSAPTFSKFFSGSPAQAGQRVFRITSQGGWQEVTAPGSSRLTNGEAFFVRSKGPSDFVGPIQVILPQRDRLDFGSIMQEQTIEIRNAGTNLVNLSLRPLPSADPNQMGRLPLDVWISGTNGGFHFGWTSFDGTITRSNIAPGRSWLVRVAARRRDFSSVTVNPGGNSLQALLELTEQSGSSRWLIPVAAEPSPVSGLWAGYVSINKVSQPAVTDQPVATANSFRFRLLIHVDKNGNTRMLQQVIQMWQDGTTKPDPQNPELRVVDVPGHYVLLTDETLTGGYQGSTLRDGRPAGRRMSSVVFGFRNRVTMIGAGDFAAPQAWRRCQIELGYDDPVNPFKHKFHPDHDNRREADTQLLREGAESYSVHRDVLIEFAGQDPEGRPQTGWGADVTGGTYRETITGLHKSALNVEGTFRLQRVSRVDALIDRP